jgi:hypothetical protein
LCHGTIKGSRESFVPDTWSFMTMRLFPYMAKKGFACLDCGFMGHYLDATALTKLRNEDTSDLKPKGPMGEV